MFVLDNEIKLHHSSEILNLPVFKSPPETLKLFAITETKDYWAFVTQIWNNYLLDRHLQNNPMKFLVCHILWSMMKSLSLFRTWIISNMDIVLPGLVTSPWERLCREGFWQTAHALLTTSPSPNMSGFLWEHTRFSS